jgi:hypothetical protein
VLNGGDFVSALLWGLVASTALSVVIEGGHALRKSRLSLPFVLGTFASGRRDVAMILGFVFYIVGGLVFSLGYWLFFLTQGVASWWSGALLGLLHALFLLVVVLPITPFIHPRMATEHDGPTPTRRLEPPGFMGLNYGRETPLIAIAGHTLYGLILGLGAALHAG